LYEIHLDNDADAIEDITFQFRFQRVNRDLALDVGPAGATERVSVPLVNIGPISLGDTGALNVNETYTVTIVRGDRRTGMAQPVAHSGGAVFTKPVDNIGTKSIPDYAGYAAQFLYEIQIPGCATPGRVFVGQRKDPFVVNLGETFDLVHTNPLGPENGESDDLADKNVTALCLEIPVSCLLDGAETTIGGWTTASLRQARVLNPAPVPPGSPGKGASVEGGAYTQQSRLGMPLVNEVVIGLKDKDRFNASEPKDDGQFATYVTHPTLPELIEILFGVEAPNAFPRADLVQGFLTGVTGLNQPAGVVPSEMLRLNTAIAPKPKGMQARLGVLSGDTAGFPNGRRPGDDVVDIALRVVMGVLLPVADAPDGQRPYTDGAFCDDSLFDTAFPYLRTPIPGARD
ncbi:MAG: DUF4331 domain-containing protein, partial [Actinobacteria bacterium]|nr:DUF4331 domain-containing protein [Actinomycetota bacterium]